MKKKDIVKDNKLFNIIIQKGKSIKNDNFILCYEKNNVKEPHFGIAVGTKLGKAHERNKYKRQIRAIIDRNKKLFSNNYDYIIIMKKASSMIKFNEMEQSLVNLIEKVNK